MADREFVFSHPEVQRLIRERFVPLAMDDWYLRRRNDAEGRFFMDMTKESPRGDAGDRTRQGRYVFTAAGKFLGFNNNRGPDRILAMLRDSLTKWEALPEAERRPATVPAEAPEEARYRRVPPADGAVVKVFTRVLDRAGDGTLQAVKPPEAAADDFRHRGLGAAVDHLWLNASDLKALLQAAAGPAGTAVPLPRPLAHRVARYHLVDDTRGEPPHWSRDEVKTCTVTLVPESPRRARLRGEFHLETADGARGFKGSLDGWLEHDGSRLTTFTAAAVGDHWGESPLTRGARPGKSPLGVAFVLCPSPGPADSIPPQAARWLDGYWEPDKN